MGGFDFAKRGRRQAELSRAFEKVNRAGSGRARHLCELIVQEIQMNPDTPYDTRATTDTRGEHLRDSYTVRKHPDGSGRWQVVTNRRYWRYVEFGTKEHGDAQPHIRPAVERVRAIIG